MTLDDEAAIRELRDDETLSTLIIALGQARKPAQARAALKRATKRPA